MAKKSAAEPVTPNTPTAVTAKTTPARTTQTSSQLSPRSSPQQIVLHVWNKYLNETPSRTKLLDVFLVFLVLNGSIQFLYCILAGNYPFNAFLSGFCSAVGQFVLTASLRMQTQELPPSTTTTAKKPASKTIDTVTGEIVEEGQLKISSERAFADFIFGSLILHAFCINFIN